MEITPDERLDLRGTICPLNFVETMLKLEEMAAGQILEVILDDGEAMRNVPRSVKGEGHRVVKLEKLGESYSLWIRCGGE